MYFLSWTYKTDSFSENSMQTVWATENVKMHYHMQLVEEIFLNMVNATVKDLLPIAMNE